MPSNHEIVMDYVSQTELTASNVFSPQNVGVVEFINCLFEVIRATQKMDKFKKALFRKRTRDEADLPLMEPQPLLSEALGERVDELADLFHGIVGNVTEVGEQAEILYWFLIENREPDMTNVREEIGDNLWYLARLIKFAKTSFPAEMEANIAKLRARHGTKGFSKDGDINRNLDAERQVLEGGFSMEVSQAIPDPRCPDCGADVDENCENLDNCPRYMTGEYARDGLEHKNEGLADHPADLTPEERERNVQFMGGEGEEVLD
jgi:NTP pyrophosphatase (non-canonical NTP hydrolase)